jgi:hypothetical protein
VRVVRGKQTAGARRSSYVIQMNVPQVACLNSTSVRVPLGAAATTSTPELRTTQRSAAAGLATALVFATPLHSIRHFADRRPRGRRVVRLRRASSIARRRTNIASSTRTLTASVAGLPKHGGAGTFRWCTTAALIVETA